MKKTNFVYASAIMMAFAFGVQSCTVEDNPAVPTPTPKPEPVYEAVFTYDFAAVAVAGENPANKNGSAANGQAFFAWEAENKTNSKRQDYKGYEWAEGSVLPQECHVWRRSDRINNNIVEGGLNCPNNREMAIDGLEAGYRVEIVYDATAAADDAKEIIWAAAVDNTENGTGPVNTAKIAGEDAVSGVTTIASGAAIDVQTVTPAENGTGYITFKVSKGMIIQKITISKLTE